jgi:hypothetical protein
MKPLATGKRHWKQVMAALNSLKRKLMKAYCMSSTLHKHIFSTGRYLMSFLLIIFIFNACSPSRHVIKEPLKEAKATYLLEKLSENELQFNWFSAKFSIDYIYDKKLTEFKGQIRIRKDSIIWLSFTPALGIEMARLKITNDSVFFMNRINKTYLRGDYKLINEYLQTNIDFDILKKFVKHGESDAKVFYQNIWLNPETFKITRVNLKEIQDDKKLDTFYSNFKEHEGQLFPFKITFEITADEKIVVKVDYSRIRIDEPKSFPFSIPSKYERIY